MVHGGERFKASVLIDDAVLRAIEECFDLAPLHNPPNVKGYRAARDLLRDVPHVAVFDTAFHQTMEPVAYLYGLPYVLYQRHGDPALRLPRHLAPLRVPPRRPSCWAGLDDPALRVITCHLGNGCSVAAIRGGRSVDTSMGFTPLEGLVMGSRSGDLDPAILLHVMAKEELGAAELNALLNKHSGLLGRLGPQQRHAQAPRGRGGGQRAREAGRRRLLLPAAQVHRRLRRRRSAALDALVFTGGHRGERARRAGALGRGARARWGSRSTRPGTPRRGAGRRRSRRAGAACRVQVIPTNEELLIARDTFRIVRGLPLGMRRDRTRLARRALLALLVVVSGAVAWSLRRPAPPAGAGRARGRRRPRSSGTTVGDDRLPAASGRASRKVEVKARAMLGKEGDAMRLAGRRGDACPFVARGTRVDTPRSRPTSASTSPRRSAPRSRATCKVRTDDGFELDSESLEVLGRRGAARSPRDAVALPARQRPRAPRAGMEYRDRGRALAARPR